MATALNVTMENRGPARVGSSQALVTLFTVTAGGYSWDLYRAANESWWEGCGNCSSDSGYKPWFSHVFGGVCFQCGGTGANRIAAADKAMMTKIRRRVSSRKGTLTANERREEAQRAEVDAWNVAHPNLASDLASVRAAGTFDTLGRLALTANERPLSVRQEAYAISLLTERSWDAAHASTHEHVGVVGERIDVVGTVTVAHYLPSERYDRSSAMMIVIDTGTALIKMVTGAGWAFEVEKGSTLTLTAKVRKHVTNDFGHQTEVSHPRKAS